MGEPASFTTEIRDGKRVIQLSGAWTLAWLPSPLAELDQQLQALAAEGVSWDLTSMVRLDSAGALLLWRAWGKQWPLAASIPEEHRHVLLRAESVPAATALPVVPAPTAVLGWLEWFGLRVLRAGSHLRDGLSLVGAILLDIFWLFTHPRETPMVASASISSVTRITPICAVIAEPERPATSTATNTGPSSRMMLMPRMFTMNVSAPNSRS